MKIPKEIKYTIKKIEELGYNLAKYEKILYKWLDDNNINYKDNTDLDTDLNILFYNHDGNDLLKNLKNSGGENK